MHKFTRIFLGSLVATISSASAAVYSPIAIEAGYFDRDVIHGSGTAIGAAGATSNFGFTNAVLYENGIAAQGGGTLSGGLASDGALSVLDGADTYNFQFAPDGAANVRVHHGGARIGTMTLSTAGQYTSLSLLGHSNAAASVLNYTVNYDSGAADTGSFSFGLYTATSGPGLVATPFRSNSGNTWNGTATTTGVGLYHRDIAVDSSRNVTSVTLEWLGNNSGVYALSGVMVPEPSVALLGIFGGLALILRRQR
ncbi:hypothetical protein NT6N_17150 [Oceaniferula spumae]|uniref:PEP-CTERM protein-sorting domain-containing protein n=1 Tax=Oceaniferula spumae TaxID=2979115 RepID=A0AAT9FL34_9BACT